MKSPKWELDDLDADDLLKQIEQPQRKRRKISEEKTLHSDDREYPNMRRNSISEESEEDEDGSSIATEEEEEIEGKELKSYLPPDDRVSRLKLPSRAPLPERTSRTKDSTPKEHVAFVDLGVSKALVASLLKMSIRAPTEVQAACIPPLIAGKFS